MSKTNRRQMCLGGSQGMSWHEGMRARIWMLTGASSLSTYVSVQKMLSKYYPMCNNIFVSLRWVVGAGRRGMGRSTKTKQE